MSEHSEQLNELAKALAAAQGEFPKIAPTEIGKIKGEGKNGAYEYEYKYADLAAVVDTVQPILSKHGLSVAQFISVTEGGKDTLTTWLMHESGQFITSSMRLYLKKDDSQGQGSAVTYARRYSYSAALGLVVDEDDDGRAASQNQRNRSGAKPKPQPKPARADEADPTTGEIPDPPNVSAVIAKLDQEGRKELLAKMEKSNYPPIEQLPPAAAKTVVKWAQEIQEAHAKEAPFS
jgi:hypothetical protein